VIHGLGISPAMMLLLGLGAYGAAPRQSEADATAAALDAPLAARGLDTAGMPETKPRAALQAFSER
jgi:hypothetical protein